MASVAFYQIISTNMCVVILLIPSKILTEKVNKPIARYFYESDPTSRGYRNWWEIGTFEIIENRLADQGRVVRVNGWSTEVKQKVQL